MSPLRTTTHITILVLLVIGDLLGIYALAWFNTLPQIEMSTERELYGPAVTDDLSGEDRQFFVDELRKSGITSPSGEGGALQILKWTMNQASRVGPSGSRGSGREKLVLAREGQGMLCGDLSTIYRDALLSVGYKARRVIGLREIFGRDSHTTVEVLIDEEWKIFDPTYHTSPTVRGRVVGAAQLRKAILTETLRDELSHRYYGPVRYPARIEQIALAYPMYFDNTFIETRASTGLSRLVPFVGVFAGPLWTSIDDLQTNHASIRTYQIAYFLLLVILPAVIVAAAAAFGLAVLRRSSSHA